MNSKLLVIIICICIPIGAQCDSATELSKYENDLLNFGQKELEKQVSVEDDKWFQEIETMDVEYVDNTLNLEQKHENRGFKYSGLDHSLIPWKKLDPKKWMDLSEWKRERALKDKHPKWMVALKTRNLVEIMGRVLDCVGICRSYRGDSFANIQYKSAVKEGDEITTEKNSYLWIFLMDGTLVRLSPESSISFKEINISNDRFFFNVRVNQGNVLWLSRILAPIKESSERETDSLFLPLRLFEANYIESLKEPNEDDLYKFLVGSRSIERQYKYLNKLIKDNNEFIKNRKSQTFLVMPNGSILGENLQLELVVLSRGKSYFKNRNFTFYNSDITDISQVSTFYYRGHINRDTFDLGVDTWYEVDEEGKNIIPYEMNDPNFSFGEYLTKRIPTIMVAREMMIQKYSQKLFDKTINEKELAENNYRLWDGRDKVVDNEMDKRFEFLREFTRREETTTLRVSKRFQEIMAERGEVMGASPYSEDYYNKAVTHFIMVGNKRKEHSIDGEILNSTKKRFWELIHSRRGDK